MSDKRTKYCVFWIPCVTHNELQVIEDKKLLSFPQIDNPDSYHPLYQTPLSDKGSLLYKIDTIANKLCGGTKTDDAKFLVTVKIEIRLKSGDRVKNWSDFTVEMKSVEYRHCGLIEFEYSLTDSEHKKFDYIKDTVYHQIKSHFHDHYHHAEDTPLMKGYYVDSKVDLKRDDNDILKYYLEQVHSNLSTKAQDLHDDYVYLVNGSFASEDDKRAKIRQFYLWCEELLGQFVFYSSLLNSKRNVSCRLIPSKPNFDPELRRLAHNIYNIIGAVKAIYRRSRSSFYLANIVESGDLQREIKGMVESNGVLTRSNNELATKIDAALTESKETNKTNRLLGIWSFVLGIISILLGGIGVWQGCANKKTIKDTVPTTQVVKVRADGDTVKR